MLSEFPLHMAILGTIGAVSYSIGRWGGKPSLLAVTLFDLGFAVIIAISAALQFRDGMGLSVYDAIIILLMVSGPLACIFWGIHDKNSRHHSSWRHGFPIIDLNVPDNIPPRPDPKW